MRALAVLPHSSWRAWLREHPVYATAAMVTALAMAARHATENALSILEDAEEIAATLLDHYDGPYARYLVWSTRGVVLRELKRSIEAKIALDRASAALDDAPDVFAAPFRADLALDCAALLLEIGDSVAARRAAWAAGEWFAATGERAGLARIAMICR